MRKIILAILLAMSIDGMAQNIDNDSINWTYLKNAIDSGVPKFMHKNSGLNNQYKYTIFVLKLIYASKDSGEFAIKLIHHSYEYDALKSTNYREIEGQIVVICDHTQDSVVFKGNQFLIIDDSVKNKIVENLAYTKKINEKYTAEIVVNCNPSPIMVVKYNKEALTTTYYHKQDDADDIYVYDY